MSDGIPSEFIEQYPFEEIGTITASQYSIGANVRSESLVDAIDGTKKVIYKVPSGTPAIEIRFRSNGNDDDDVVVFVLAKPRTSGSITDPEHYVPVCKFIMKQGCQYAENPPTKCFIDDIVMTDINWPSNPVVITATAIIGRVLINTYGYEKFVFTTSVKDMGTLYVDIRRHDKEF